MKKKMTKAVVTIIMCLISVASYAQDVDSVQVLTVMTKDQVIARFGKPDEYSYYDSGEDGIEEYYHYGESFLKFHDSRFIEFTICDSRFSVLKYDIPGGVKVGNPFEILAPLVPRRATWLKGECYALFAETDCLVFVEVSDGKITCVWYSEPL